MNAEATLGLARSGELYPAVIVHGAGEGERRDFALALGRTLLCSEPPAGRPCGACRHCRRIDWPAEGAAEHFHPDFQVLERDLKTATSVDATRALLRIAQVSPFEARGQVFVIANAETLTAEAANSLLKALEEPHASAPRHFLLLTPSRLDLLPTLRSRSLAVYLGAAEAVGADEVSGLAEELAGCLAAYADSGAAVYLLAAAEVLKRAGKWEDPRAGRPWAVAAAAVVEAVRGGQAPPGLSRRLLALAESLLAAPPWRLRAVPVERILEGLVAHHLAGPDREAV